MGSGIYSKKCDKHRSLSVLVSALMLILLVITPAWAADSSTSDSNKIIDGYGNTASIPQNVNTIIVIQGACNVPSLLCALGVGDKLIQGLCFKTPLQIKLQPEYVNIDPLQAQNGEANVEDLVKQNADIVFGWTNLKNGQAIRDAGVNLFIVNLDSFDEMVETIKSIAKITGTEKKGDELLQTLNETIQMIDNKVSTISQDKKKKVLLLTKSDPITVMGADTFNRGLIEKAGGICVTDNMPGYFLETDMEQILKLDPDIILVSATGGNSYNDIMNSTAWDSVRAKKEGHVYQVPTGVFYWDKPGSENNLFILWEANKFYPDLISTDTLKSEAQKFYKKFFNYDLSDEDFNSIVNPVTKAKTT